VHKIGRKRNYFRRKKRNDKIVGLKLGEINGNRYQKTRAQFDIATLSNFSLRKSRWVKL